MPEPMLRAVPAPDRLLPKNARSMLKLLSSHGWSVGPSSSPGTATYSIGWDLPKTKTKKALESEAALADDGEEIEIFLEPEVVHAVMVQGTKGVERLELLWSGPERDELSFSGAVHAPPFRSLNYSEVTHLVKGTEPVLTPAAQAKLNEEWETTRAALAAAMAIGQPIEVLRHGTSSRPCKGKVRHGQLWLDCSGRAEKGNVLCDGPCTDGLIFDGT